MSENQSSDVELSWQRQLACLEAAWELAALARQLPIIVPLDDSTNQQHFVIRGVVARIDKLASIVISAIHEDEEIAPTKNLRRDLFIL